MPNVAINNLSETWNNAGTTFTGIKLNVTDTASASGSLLLDVQKGGTSQLALNKNGALVATGTGRFGDGFRVEGTGTGLTGTGIGAELFVAGSVAYISSYNRTTSAYSALSFYGSTIEFIAGSERQKFGGSSVVFNDPGNDYDFRVEGDTDANLLFVDASTDRVGIGTNAPGLKFDIQQSISTEYDPAAFSPAIARVFNTYGSAGNTMAMISYASSNYSSQWYVGLVDSSALGAQKGSFVWQARTGASTNAERMRLDSSGNLGLGVTPSAWTIRAFQSSLGVFAGNTEFNTSANAYYDGAWKYIGTGVASRYGHAGATHYWYTATSGTAGAAVTFTERMRLDSSGNLGLGVTPSAWNTNYNVLQIGNGVALWGSVSSITTPSAWLTSNMYFDSLGARKYIIDGFAAEYNVASGAHIFKTAASGTANTTITVTERMSIGNTAFVINDPGNDYDFRVEGDTDANLFFVDASTDRVGIGTNAPAHKFHVTTSSADTNVFLSQTDNRGLFLQWRYSATVANAYGEISTFGGDNNLFIQRQSGAGNTNLNLLSGNVGLRTSTFGTSASGVLAIGTGTAPTTGPADTIQIYSSDVSAGNTTLSIYTEGTPVSDSTDNAVTKKIAVRINGTLYYLLADTDNS